MGWFYVFLAAVSELIGVLGLNLFSKKHTFKNSIIYLGGLGASFIFIYSSFRYLPLSIAYTVWIGIGTAGAVLINMIFFGESKSWKRIASIIAIIIGVIGLESL